MKTVLCVALGLTLAGVANAAEFWSSPLSSAWSSPSDMYDAGRVDRQRQSGGFVYYAQPDPAPAPRQPVQMYCHRTGNSGTLYCWGG